MNLKRIKHFWVHKQTHTEFMFRSKAHPFHVWPIINVLSSRQIETFSQSVIYDNLFKTLRYAYQGREFVGDE